MSFTEFLRWLTSSEGGALLIVMWIVSWGLEELAWWQHLASKVKSLIILGIAILIGLFGVWAMTWPPEVIAAIEPYFRALTVIIMLWLGSQVAYRASKLLQ